MVRASTQNLSKARTNKDCSSKVRLNRDRASQDNAYPPWLEAQLPAGARSVIGRRCLLVESDKCNNNLEATPGQLRVKYGETLADAYVLQREAEWLHRLRHLNVDIPQCVTFYRNGTQCVLITNYLSGSSASDWLLAHQNSPSYIEQLRPYIESTFDALDYFHQQGLVHGDIKPGNILFGANGQATLIDFSNMRRVDQPWQERGFNQYSPSFRYPEPAEVAKFEHDYFALLISVAALFKMERLSSFRSLECFVEYIESQYKSWGLY
ncbi:protein kinase family protein, partial [Photobacterium sanctipauli]